jgi:hypothetical protein
MSTPALEVRPVPERRNRGKRTLLSLKLACLALYGSAIVATAGGLPARWSEPLVVVSLVVLAVHTLEVPFALNGIRRDSRAFASGLLFTLLFGALHWLPSTQRARGRAQ